MRRLVMTVLSAVLTSAIAAAPGNAGALDAETTGIQAEAQATEREAPEVDDLGGGAPPSVLFHKAGWALLSGALVLAGLVLSRETLAGRVPGFQRVVGALATYATAVGAVAVLVALVDFALDLLSVRPIIGDGIPQVLALAGGALLVRSSAGTMSKLGGKASDALEKHEDKLARLEGKRQALGIACLVGGIVHVILPAMPFV